MKQLFLLTTLAYILTVTSCKVDKCKDVNCQNGGICNNGNCQCPPGYSGANCGIHSNPCDTSTCLNGGMCVSGVCNCPTGFTGVHCEVHTNSCVGITCLNGGTCVDGVCQCNSAFTGDRCQTHTNACDTLRCHYGYCATGHCNCDPHVSGDSCTILETPSKMYITGVTIDHFSPATLGGYTWDYDEVGMEQGTRPDIYPVIKKNGITIYAGRQHNLSYNYFQDAQYDSQHKFIFHEDSIPITGSDVSDSIFRFELYDYDFGSGVDDSDYMGGFNFRPFTGRDGFPGGVSYHDTTFYYDEFEYRLNYSPYYEW